MKRTRPKQSKDLCLSYMEIGNLIGNKKQRKNSYQYPLSSVQDRNVVSMKPMLLVVITKVHHFGLS